MKKIKKEWDVALEGEKEVWRKNPSFPGRMLVALSAPFVIVLSLMLGTMGME